MLPYWKQAIALGFLSCLSSTLLADESQSPIIIQKDFPKEQEASAASATPVKTSSEEPAISPLHENWSEHLDSAEKKEPLDHPEEAGNNYPYLPLDETKKALKDASLDAAKVMEKADALLQGLQDPEKKLHPQQAGVSDIKDFNFLDEFVRMSVVLAALVAAMLIISWLLKRLLKARVHVANTSSQIKIREQRTLSPKSQIYLIEVHGQSFLIGESPQGLHHLGSIEHKP